MNVAQIKSGYNDPSKSMFWKELETVLSHHEASHPEMVRADCFSLPLRETNCPKRFKQIQIHQIKALCLRKSVDQGSQIVEYQKTKSNPNIGKN